MKLLLQHPRRWREICDDPRLIPNAVEECLRHNGSVAAWRRLVTARRAGRRRRPSGRLEAADRHLVGQPRRAPLRRRRPVRHPARQRQRPPHLRLRLAPVHGQEPGAHGDADLPGGAHAAAAAHAAVPRSASATCPTPRSAAPSTCGSNGTRRRTRSAAAGAARRGAAPVRHRRAVEARDHAAGAGRERRRRRPTASSGCAWSRPTAGRCRAGRRARTSTSNAATRTCRASTRCAATRPTRSALEIAVLREPEGRGGSAWVHANVQRRRPAQDPRRRATISASTSRRSRLIFIAGGIGITPIAAMARRARSSASTTRCTTAAARAPSDGPGRRACRAAWRAAASSTRGDEGRRNDLAALLRQPERRHPGLRLRPGAHARRARRGASAPWPEDSLRVEHFESTPATLDPAREHAFEVELEDSGLVVHGARRPDPARAPCAPPTSTCAAIARRACAARARSRCWPARSTTATSCSRAPSARPTRR